MNRRRFVASTLALIAGREYLAAAKPDVDSIAAGITGPHFPDREFDVTKYGAVGDGVTNCTQAIHKAMAACSSSGGGRVLVPAGRFLTGALHLESNVNLHLAKGATLSFSRDPKDYLPLVFTRFEGTECMNYSPFLYAFEKTNVGVSGPGTLDGQANEEYWWPMANKTRSAVDRIAIVAMGDKNVPVQKRIFGEGHSLRPNFVQPYRCTNVLLEDFSIINSPMWELNPVLCKNVVVRNVSIDSHGPNNDGCDPESCDGVLIEGCTFSTGDDCIAVKSGRNADGRRVNVPCQNVVIRNCNMKDGHGGVSIGSEVSGGIRGIYTENCQMSSPHLQRALRIKTNSYRGGTIENIGFRNVTVGQVAEAVIEVDFFYEEGEGGPLPPVVRGIDVANVTCEKSKYAIFLRGFANDPISGVSIANCTFNNAAEGVLFQNVKAVDLKDVLVNGKVVSKPS